MTSAASCGGGRALVPPPCRRRFSPARRRAPVADVWQPGTPRPRPRRSAKRPYPRWCPEPVFSSPTVPRLRPPPFPQRPRIDSQCPRLEVPCAGRATPSTDGSCRGPRQRRGRFGQARSASWPGGVGSAGLRRHDRGASARHFGGGAGRVSAADDPPPRPGILGLPPGRVARAEVSSNGPHAAETGSPGLLSTRRGRRSSRKQQVAVVL